MENRQRASLLRNQDSTYGSSFSQPVSPITFFHGFSNYFATSPPGFMDKSQELEQARDALAACRQKLRRKELELGKLSGLRETLINKKEELEQVPGLRPLVKVLEEDSECGKFYELEAEKARVQQQLNDLQEEKDEVYEKYQQLYSDYCALQNRSRSSDESLLSESTQDGKVEYEKVLNQNTKIKKEIEEHSGEGQNALEILQGKVEELRKELEEANQKKEDLQQFIREQTNSQIEQYNQYKADYSEMNEKWKIRFDAAQKNYQFELNRKQSQITNLKKFIEDNLPSLKVDMQLDECSKCVSKNEELFQLRSQLQQLRDYINSTQQKTMQELSEKDKEIFLLKHHQEVALENYKSSLKVVEESIRNTQRNCLVYPGTKALRHVIESIEKLESWWQRGIRNMSDSEAAKEGTKCVEALGQTIQELVEAKPAATSGQGLPLRKKVHQQIITVEQAFNDLPEVSKEVAEIKDKFLELPYTLKQLFDLMKEYEKQGKILEANQEERTKELEDHKQKLEKAIEDKKLVLNSPGESPFQPFQRNLPRINTQFRPNERLFNSADKLQSKYGVFELGGIVESDEYEDQDIAIPNWTFDYSIHSAQL